MLPRPARRDGAPVWPLDIAPLSLLGSLWIISGDVGGPLFGVAVASRGLWLLWIAAAAIWLLRSPAAAVDEPAIGNVVDNALTL